MASASAKGIRSLASNGAAALSKSSSPAASRSAGSIVRRRLLSTAPTQTAKESGTSNTNALLRGLFAGAGLSLAAGLIAYRTGIISVSGDSSANHDVKYGSHEDVQKAISELRTVFDDPHRVVTDPDALKTYGSSPNSYHPASPHSVFVHVMSTEDVVKVVNIARKYKIPVVAYSGATSLEGHYSGVRAFDIELGEAYFDVAVSNRYHRAASVWTCLEWTRFSRFMVCMFE